MTDKKIDVRGKSCPYPVVQTKKALEEMTDGILEVIVDNPGSKDNVIRFAESQGCQVKEEKIGTDFQIKIAKSACSIDTSKKSEAGSDIELVVYVASNTMGEGDSKLGEILIQAFFKTIPELKVLPKKMIFVNSGVFLTTEDSKVIEALKKLEEKGIKIMSCGTCLDYYHRLDKVKVGIITNMLDIVSSLSLADRIIRP